MGHLDGMASHLAEGNPEFGLTPSLRDGVLGHASKIGMRHLVLRSVDNREPGFAHAEVGGDLRDTPPRIKLVVNVCRFHEDRPAVAALAQERSQFPEQFGIGDNRAVFCVVSEHERGLDHDAQFLGALSQLRGTLLQFLGQTAQVEQPEKYAALFFLDCAGKNPNASSAANLVLRHNLPTQTSRQKIFADLGDLRCQGFVRFSWGQPVLVVERLRQDLENPRVPFLVFAYAHKITGQLASQLWRLLRQRNHPFVTETRGPLCVHIELAKIPKRTVVQILANIFRNFSCERTQPGDRGRRRARNRRVPPWHMLPHRARPAAEHSAELLPKCFHSQEWSAQLEQGAANVNGVHFLVAPRPNERVADQLPHGFAKGHTGEPFRHQLLAIANGDEFFAFQGHQTEAKELLTRARDVLLLPGRQLLTELVVNQPHTRLPVPIYTRVHLRDKSLTKHMYAMNHP